MCRAEMAWRLPLDRLVGLAFVLALHAAALYGLWQHRLIPSPQEAMTLFVNFIAPPAGLADHDPRAVSLLLGQGVDPLAQQVRQAQHHIFLACAARADGAFLRAFCCLPRAFSPRLSGSVPPPW